MNKRLICCLLVFLIPLPILLAEDWKADVASLTQGVTRLDKAGIPGPMVVFGKRAFPVALGKMGGGRQVLIAAARYGGGRVVAFGHGGYLSPDGAGKGRLLENAVRWCLARKAGKVGVVGNDRLLARLQRAGLDVVAATSGGLTGLAVLVADAHHLRKGHLDDLEAFVKRGGGLVTASLGWGWKQLNPGRTLLVDHLGNRLLVRVGLVWADGYLETTAGKQFAVGQAPGALLHAGLAMDALLEHQAGKAELADAAMTQAAATLTTAVRSLPAGSSLLSRLAKQADGGQTRQPTDKQPLRPSDALARVVLSYQIARAQRVPAKQVRAHPAARDFPGVPPAGAAAQTRTLQIDTRIPDWHGTGLYAAPGALVTVAMPAKVGQGFRVVIGCHRDQIWHKPSWRRAPRITRSFDVTSARTEAACAFGGLIFISVPKGRGSLGTIEVTISGGIAAPHYVHGVTSLEAWRKTIRHHPAPWAEIGSRKMIVCVPSSMVRTLDDPDALMQIWDRVVDLNKELCGRSAAAQRPMRMVCDRQISAGYMHAGYPIMTHLDQQQNLVDAAHLKQGNWGFFHEIGHNHQHRDWTFGGTGEVTCNLFTLYVFDKLCGVSPAKHPRMKLESRRQLMGRYSFDNPDFSQWQRSPFLALVMYVQLQQSFGWKTYQRVFREYLGLRALQRPRSEMHKREMWMTRFSLASGRDLGPFFELWGVPTTKNTRDKLSDLPGWFPEEIPPRYRKR